MVPCLNGKTGEAAASHNRRYKIYADGIACKRSLHTPKKRVPQMGSSCQL
jgi:hypothetical protein